jgi:hypothetical protein
VVCGFSKVWWTVISSTIAFPCLSQALQKIADKIKGQPIDVVLFLDRLDLYRVDPLDRSVSGCQGVCWRWKQRGQCLSRQQGYLDTQLLVKQCQSSQCFGTCTNWRMMWAVNRSMQSLQHSLIRPRLSLSAHADHPGSDGCVWAQHLEEGGHCADTWAPASDTAWD